MKLLDLKAMSLQKAFRRLTSQPASIFGMTDRGMIKEGMDADLLLFDPETVSCGPKHRVFDLPGGAARLTTDAVGVHGVWVNGQQVADNQGLLKVTATSWQVVDKIRFVTSEHPLLVPSPAGRGLG